MKLKITESQYQLIVEGIEHIQKLYKSWASKKSGNPQAAMGIMDDVIKYRRSLPKKDFAKYTSYEELKSDIDKIIDAQASKDIEKFYEDDELLVMAANSWEASCKYGSNTKWCTTARDTDSYWRRHNETGTEFFWIFKNTPTDNPNHKYSFHAKDRGGFDICDAVNKCGNENTPVYENSLIPKHPKHKEIIEKIMNYHGTRSASREEDRKKRDAERVARMGESDRWLYENEHVIEEWIDDHVQDMLDKTLDEIGGIDMILEDYLSEIMGDIVEDMIAQYLSHDSEYEDAYQDFIFDELGMTRGHGYTDNISSIISDAGINPNDIQLDPTSFEWVLNDTIKNGIRKGELGTDTSRWENELLRGEMTHELGYGLHEVSVESFDDVLMGIETYIMDLIEEKEPEIEKMIEAEDY